MHGQDIGMERKLRDACFGRISGRQLIDDRSSVEEGLWVEMYMLSSLQAMLLLLAISKFNERSKII